MDYRVLYRFTRALLPPLMIILFRCLPVVNKGTPILSIRKRYIKQHTYLAIRIRVVQLGPYLRAITTSTSESVAFGSGAFFTNVISYVGWLSVWVMLYMMMGNSFFVAETIQYTWNYCFFYLMLYVLEPLTRVQDTVRVS